MRFGNPAFRLRVDSSAGFTMGKGGRSWDYMDLGDDLFDAWDAEDASSFTLVGSAVSAWRSRLHGYSTAQAVAAARPLYSTTAINARPGVILDGADDELTYAGVGVLPVGSDPCEIWALVDQAALVADTTFRVLCAYGGTASATRRTLQRATSPGNNDALITVGDGATPVTSLASGFGGRCVVRAVVSSATARIDLNGAPGTPANVVPATSNTRLRLGANNGNTAANFFQGALSLLAVTKPLSSDQATKMLIYLKTRGGIA